MYLSLFLDVGVQGGMDPSIGVNATSRHINAKGWIQPVFDSRSGATRNESRIEAVARAIKNLTYGYVNPRRTQSFMTIETLVAFT